MILWYNVNVRKRENKGEIEMLNLIPEYFGWMMVGASAVIAAIMFIKVVKCFIEMFKVEEEY
jgi:hypothetical protein